MEERVEGEEKGEEGERAQEAAGGEGVGAGDTPTQAAPVIAGDYP